MGRYPFGVELFHLLLHAGLSRRFLKTEANLDGKYLLRCSDPHLPAADIARGYKQLLEVERGWRDMKGALGLRPVFHHREDRVRGHVQLCWLALLLTRVVENAVGDTWRNIRDDLKAIKLAQLLSPNGTVWQVTEPTPAAAKCLKALGIKNPPPILDLG